MNKEIIKNWNLYKKDLENYIRTNKQENYDSYLKLVKLIIKYILPDYNSEKITEIDDGDYQGTNIFLIPKDEYQPDVTDYLYTHNYYGSCSGCDTLLGIQGYNEDIPTETQVKDYMNLCLHLVQKIKPLTDKETEILDEENAEFEDIEEYQLCLEDLTDTRFIKINQLIRNQKKIIEHLKRND